VADLSRLRVVSYCAEPVGVAKNTEKNAKPNESPTFLLTEKAPVDVVEATLASAIAKATEASEWSVVVQLAKELEARRLARSAPNVVDLAKRTKRQSVSRRRLHHAAITVSVASGSSSSHRTSFSE
jgi:hypothetical protein